MNDLKEKKSESKENVKEESNEESNDNIDYFMSNENIKTILDDKQNTFFKTIGVVKFKKESDYDGWWVLNSNNKNIESTEYTVYEHNDSLFLIKNDELSVIKNQLPNENYQDKVILSSFIENKGNTLETVLSLLNIQRKNKIKKFNKWDEIRNIVNNKEDSIKKS